MADNAGLLRDHAAIPEDEKVRNPAHIESACKIGVTFRIDFQNDGPACHVRCSPCNLGRGHAAWPAPRRPEVDQHRHARMLSDFLEQLRISLQRLCQRWQCGLAGATSPAFAEMLRRHPILPSTTRTCSDYRHIHSW